ncbi:MAG: glycosyltransferase [Ilumatobacter sp.]|nr:glycosyltransferase [Ilumatobacter sp.]
MATRDRPESLRRCVSSILASANASTEILVIDQSERPSTLTDDPRVRHIPTRTVGKSAALNVGIAAARGALLAFTDDDCTVPADWLASAEALLDGHPDVGMAFGLVKSIEHDPSQTFVPTVEFDEFRIMERARDAHVRGGGGGDLIARSELFDEVGLWDETIGPGARFPGCEEWDLYFRALSAGVPVAMTPDVEVLHWGARPYADGSGQSLIRSYAYGEGAVIGKHLRLRNADMLVPMCRILVDDLARIVESFRHRRLSGVGALAWKCRGIVAGLLAPVDRQAVAGRAP